MADVHHFTYGALTPSIAYVLSVLGSLLGLICTARARTAPSSGPRAWWLILAAGAIGGTGIWSMHFMAMLGFTVTGATIRYDVGVTAGSAIIAILVVGIGLFIAGFGTPKAYKTVFGGIFTGLGVAAMHYTGMFAMRMDGNVDYDGGLVAASILIAVVAATVALTFTVTISKPKVIFGAALLMGVAVCGMHYTAMTAMSVQLTDPTFDSDGATALYLLFPIAALVLVVIGMLVFAIGAAPTNEDYQAREYLDQLKAKRESMVNVESAPGRQQAGGTARRRSNAPRG